MFIGVVSTKNLLPDDTTYENGIKSVPNADVSENCPMFIGVVSTKNLLPDDTTYENGTNRVFRMPTFRKTVPYS
jgi:hypothetical protein